MARLAHPKLSWPAGRKPGVAANHIVNTGPGQLRFSGVALGGNAFFGLFPSFKKCTTAGTVINQINPVIGPAAGYAAAGGATRFSYSGVNASTDATQTFGIIFVDSAVATEVHFLASGNSTNYLGIGTINSNPQVRNGEFGSDFAATNITLQNNVPYFIAVSVSSAQGNFVVLNLNTGQIQTQTTSGLATAGAPSGTCTIAGDGGSFGLGGFVAAAMYTSAFLSIREMVDWAQDPWSFWYPVDPKDLIFSSLSNPTPATLPPGLQIFDVPTPQRRPDETHISFYNPTQMNTGLKPAGADYTDLPYPLGARDPRWPDRNWERFYNPTQMATGAKPSGAQSWDLSPRQLPPRPDETWTFNYNPTQMATGAKPSGAQSWDLSPRQPPPRPDETWTWTYNPTQMQTGAKPSGAQEYGLTIQQTTPTQSRVFVQFEKFYNPTQMNTGQMPVGEESLDTSQGWYTRPLFNRSYDQASANFLTVTVTQNPFFQTDWPLPIRSPPLVYGGNHPRLYGTGIQPFNQSDWPLPTPRFRPTSNWDWSTPALAFPVSLPFNQYDWPVSGRYPRPDATWVGFYNPTQMQTGAQPFAQSDWPLPTPRFRLDATWAWPTPIGYFPFAFPRNQYDWPLPGRYPRPDGTWVQFYNPTQMQTGAKPFFPIEWPLPVPLFRIDATWAWPTPQGYFPAAAPYPFNQYDWPLPVRPWRPIVGGFYDRGYPATPVPFNQYDWPLPLPAQQPIRSYDYSQSAFNVLVPYPFNQYDWPVPRGQFRIEQTTSQFYNPTQMATGTKPFAQTEWPIPLGARDPRQPDRTVASFFNPTQMATGKKPFAQTEWPLPTPPNYGNLIYYTITGANNPNIYTPSKVKIEWLIRARRRGRR